MKNAIIDILSADYCLPSSPFFLYEMGVGVRNDEIQLYLVDMTVVFKWKKLFYGCIVENVSDSCYLGNTVKSLSGYFSYFL
jgi:hypothetical protein